MVKFMSWQRVGGLVAVMLLAAGTVMADEGERGDLAVTQAWSRALPPVAVTGAVYLTLTNRGPAPRRLVGASSPVAEQVQIHNHIESDDGMMQMRQLEDITVAPAIPVQFKPHGLHLMLIGLKQPLTAGKHFPLTLMFAGGEVLEILFEVR